MSRLTLLCLKDVGNHKTYATRVQIGNIVNLTDATAWNFLLTYEQAWSKRMRTAIFLSGCLIEHGLSGTGNPIPDSAATFLSIALFFFLVMDLWEFVNKILRK